MNTKKQYQYRTRRLYEGYDTDIKDMTVKSFYTTEYDTDTLGEEINSVITFRQLWDYMQRGCDIYVLLGVQDSIVRERVMRELSKRVEVPYSNVYNTWLHND